MSLIDHLLVRLQRHPKRIVFPEGADPRVLQAARLLAARGAGVPILLGDRSVIKARAAQLDLKLEGMRLLEPERTDDFDLLLPRLQQLERYRPLSTPEARTLLHNRTIFAALMVLTGRADALCAGATESAPRTLRALFQTLPLQPGVRSASSLLVLDQENRQIGHDGMLFLADCGVQPEPDAPALASIAVTTAEISHHLTGEDARVALLSFASHASKVRHPSVARIREAVATARAEAAARKLNAVFDGELQVDAALQPEVAAQKGLTDSPVAGRANVLVFPDLNSANIGSKLVQVLAGARSYGQVITGLQYPCATISRGAHASEILGVALIVGAQAVDRRWFLGTRADTAPPAPSA